MDEVKRVSFVVWRDANTDPPEEHDAHLDIPAPVLRVRESGPIVVAYHVEDDGWYPIYNETERLDDLTDQWAPVPEPPGENAVTVGHLAYVLDLAESNPLLVGRLAEPYMAYEREAVARLRAALDALEADDE